MQLQSRSKFHPARKLIRPLHTIVLSVNSTELLNTKPVKHAYPLQSMQLLSRSLLNIIYSLVYIAACQYTVWLNSFSMLLGNSRQKYFLSLIFLKPKTIPIFHHKYRSLQNVCDTRNNYYKLELNRVKQQLIIKGHIEE